MSGNWINDCVQLSVKIQMKAMGSLPFTSQFATQKCSEVQVAKYYFENIVIQSFHVSSRLKLTHAQEYFKALKLINF